MFVPSFEAMGGISCLEVRPSPWKVSLVFHIVFLYIILRFASCPSELTGEGDVL